MSSGFDRLRGVLVASAISANIIGAGSARATTIRRTLPQNINYSFQNTGFFITNVNTDSTRTLPFYSFWGWNVGAGKNTVTYSEATASTTDATFLLNSSASASIFNARLGYIGFSSTDNSNVVGSTSSITGAFDGVMGLKIEGQSFINPSAQVALILESNNDVTVTADTVEDLGATGLDVTVSYRFFSSQPTVRALFTLQNTSTDAITVTATVVGDHHLIDGSTGVEVFGSRNASGENAVIEDDDYWYIAADTDNPASTTALGSPQTVLLRYGENAAVAPTNGDTYAGADPDTFQWNYNVTIPAGETRYLMTLAAIAQYLNRASESSRAPNLSLATAEEKAAEFGTGTLTELNTAGLLLGLDESVRSNLVNFVDPDVGDTNNTIDTTPTTTEDEPQVFTSGGRDGNSVTTQTLLLLLLMLAGRAAYRQTDHGTPS